MNEHLENDAALLALVTNLTEATKGLREIQRIHTQAIMKLTETVVALEARLNRLEKIGRQ